MGAETCPTAEPTSRQVEITPTTGVIGRIFLTTPGKNLLMLMPATIGARTTWIVDIATPSASTGTMAPNRSLHKKGVMKIAPMVVMVVINTDNATSPFAM